MGGALGLLRAITGDEGDADGRGGRVPEGLGSGEGEGREGDEAARDVELREGGEAEGKAAEFVPYPDILVVRFDLRGEVVVVVSQGVEQAGVWLCEAAG